MDRAAIGPSLNAGWEWTPESQDLKRIEYKRGATTLVKIERQDFDKTGNPGREKRTGQGPAVDKGSTFDGFERLKASSLAVGGNPLINETYQYSPGGRLLSAGEDIYLYDNLSLLGAVTSVGNRILGYDLRGNATRDEGGERKLRYDAQGCTVAIETSGTSQVHALCDADGNHVYRSTRSAEVASRVVTMGLSELRPDEGVLLHRLPLNGTVSLEVAYRLADGTRAEKQSRVVMLDSRGSVVATSTLGAGSSQASQAGDYEAWGGKVKLDPAETPRHGFVGFEPDVALGTYAFGRRIYDPKLRRWLSPDPLVLSAPEDSDSRQLDVYSYAANNPVKHTDPSGTCVPGLDPCGIQLGMAYDAGLITPGSYAGKYVEVSRDIIGDVGKTFQPSFMTSFSAGIDDLATQIGSQGMAALGYEDAAVQPGGGKLIAETTKNIFGALLSVIGARLNTRLQSGAIDTDTMGSTPRAGHNGVAGPAQEKSRVTRQGEKAVETTYPDGSTKEASPRRVKETVRGRLGYPNNKVEFESSLPGTKGKKREPTPAELEQVK